MTCVPVSPEILDRACELSGYTPEHLADVCEQFGIEDENTFSMLQARGVSFDRTGGG